MTTPQIYVILNQKETGHALPDKEKELIMRSVKMMREMNMRREKTYVRRMSISQRFFMQEKIMRSGGSLMRE
jgi:hypothetical protein